MSVENSFGDQPESNLLENAKFTMVGEAPERPVSSQLTRIEQAVTAALEGQARLNGLVDGQRERLEGIERKLALIPGIVAIVSEGKDLLSNRLTALSQQLVLLQSWIQDIEAKLESLQGPMDLQFANIHAELKQRFDDMKRLIAVSCSGELEAKRKVWKAYVDKQLRRPASKKQPKKARRAKTS